MSAGQVLMYLTGLVICVAATFLIFTVLEIARHCQYLWYRDTGFVPSTQHWCMYAIVAAVPLELAAIVCLILWAITK